MASIANTVQCHYDCQPGSQLSEIVNMFTNNVTSLSLHFSVSLYFCADRYLKKMIKKSTFLLDKYKLEYPEILANWEHSFEH